MRETYTVAAGILRQNDKILLVYQQSKTDLKATWALPGGVLEPGELLHDALVREIKEETGLTVQQIGNFAYSTQLVHHANNYQVLAFIFEISLWSDGNPAQDPDHLVTDARFFNVKEATKRLELLPSRSMREPAIHYLKQHSNNRQMWLYKHDIDG